MENVVNFGVSYIQTALAWMEDNLNKNPEVFVMFVYLIGLVIAFLALKELYDILTGSNKSALKKKLLELSEENQDLLKTKSSLELEVSKIQDHVNAIADELIVLKAIKFDEAFASNTLKEIIEKQINLGSSDDEKGDLTENVSEKENVVKNRGFLLTGYIASLLK